ncbi:MAG TPA: hypothetical protein VFT65_03490 [Candidatus Angelobacter sp.]|nr:hypothetical protein [Candidatus Angelobacter sp.]
MNNEDLQLDSLIKQMAVGHQPELPSPGLIWWRAQIVRKQAEKERVERPLAIMRLFAALVCVVVVAALWILQGRAMWSAVNSSGLISLLPLAFGIAGAAAIALALLWRKSARA